MGGDLSVSGGAVGFVHVALLFTMTYHLHTHAHTYTLTHNLCSLPYLNSTHPYIRMILVSSLKPVL